MGAPTTADEPRTDAAPTDLREVVVGERTAVRIRLPDRVVTVAARCPHKGAPLVEGLVRGAFLECPWHGATFDLRTGRRLRGPTCGDLEIVACEPGGSRPAAP
jgi:nitrite reductase/ring-hydroxylating ferredoxin subunit